MDEAERFAVEYGLVRRGRQLNESERRQLEHKISSKQEDLETVLLLLGYYQDNHRSRENLNRFASIVDWIIDHHANSSIAEALDFPQHGMLFDRLTQHWLAAIKRNPNDTMILNNAATFCYPSSIRQAERLWKRAQTLEPHNADWPHKLVRLYQYQLSGQWTPEDVSLVKKCIAEWDKVLALPKGYPRTILTPSVVQEITYQLAEAALSAKLSATAEHYARRVLNYFLYAPSVWRNKGRQWMIHQSRAILGRACAAQGNIRQAIACMAKMTNLSPVDLIDTTGVPDIVLAQQLSALGETKPTTKYLKYYEDAYRKCIVIFHQNPSSSQIVALDNLLQRQACVEVALASLASKL